MPRQVARQSLHREGGTASVELIATVPFLLLAILVAAQVALAGQALWSAGIAARAGARAALIGGNAGHAARRALPAPLRRESQVDDSEPVSVRVQVPRLFGGLPPMTVGAKASLEADG